MKGISPIIWILLLNIFDFHVCLTTVRPRKLLLDPDTPLSYSPRSLTKFRFQQPHNRLFVGFENESRKLRQMEDENSNRAAPTDAMLPNRAGLFQNVVRRSKRHSDDSFKKSDDSKRPEVLKRDRKLPIESFTGSKSESYLTQFGLLKETTKLDRTLLQTAFTAHTKKTNSAINKTVSAGSTDAFNNSNANDAISYTQTLDKSFKDRVQNEPGNSNSTEIAPLHSTLSRKPSLRLTSTNDGMTLISLSTLETPNSNSNKTTGLPVVVSSSIRAELTTKQPNTNSFTSDHRSISLTTKPFRTFTTIALLMRTSGQPLSLSTTHVPTHITTITASTSDLKQNSTTSHHTTKRKDIVSILSTPVTDTSILTTISTDAGLSTPSKPHTETINPTQPTPTPNQKSTDLHTSTIITSSTQTPATTLTPTKAITTALPLSSTTPKAPTTTSRIATSSSESSRHSSLLSTTVTASVVTDPGENTTISNSSATTNAPTNSTLENETTTFLPRRTQKVVEEDSVYFWPVVLSLVIGIPAIIVFSIAMVVILKKRNIDSSRFFINTPIGDEEV